MYYETTDLFTWGSDSDAPRFFNSVTRVNITELKNRVRTYVACVLSQFSFKSGGRFSEEPAGFLM